jgi:penicillin-binding protein 1A
MIAGVWLGNDDSSPTRKTTGGGLPVEIWGRFMRLAHHNVPPAELPGSAGRAPAAPAPMPPASVSGRPVPSVAIGESGRPAPSDGMTLDRWLIDKLFGRR